MMAVVGILHEPEIVRLDLAKSILEVGKDSSDSIDSVEK